MSKTDRTPAWQRLSSLQTRTPHGRERLASGRGSHVQQTPPSAPSPRRAPCVVGRPAGGGRAPLLSPPWPSRARLRLPHFSRCHPRRPLLPRQHAHVTTPRAPAHLAGAKAATRHQQPSGPGSGWLLGCSSLILEAGSVSPCSGPGKPTHSSGWRNNNGKTKSPVFRANAVPGLTGSSPLQQGRDTGGPSATARAASPHPVSSSASEQPLQDQTGPGKGQT